MEGNEKPVTSEPENPVGAGAGRAREPLRGPAAERPLSETVKDIVLNVQEIIRSEIRLASVEMREKAVALGKGAALLVAGGIVALYGVGFLLVCIYNAIATAVAPWLSALIVCVLLGTAAAAMMTAGRKRFRQTNPKPQATIDSLKEDFAWLKDQTK